MKKNQQLAKQVDQVHEQWARANGYRGKATSNKRGKQQASSNEELEGLKKYVREKKKPI
tara:strand:- start:1239 stop:1415 length:177 start_codon:yes stop_codon:yes gene_type:complete